MTAYTLIPNLSQLMSVFVFGRLHSCNTQYMIIVSIVASNTKFKHQHHMSGGYGCYQATMVESEPTINDNRTVISGLSLHSQQQTSKQIYNELLKHIAV